ncbi:MAG: hypothetical protein IKK70_03565 [Clostridia bacterium]|nr:hypothetical protein [Clostridia bacterium]
MKIKALILLLALSVALSLLYGCGSQHDSPTESVSGAEESTSSQEESQNKSETESESKPESESETETEGEPDNLISDGIDPGKVAGFFAYAEDAEYFIRSDMQAGYYSTTYTTEGDTILFSDGRTLPMTYSEYVYSEEKGVYETVINGRNYALFEYVDTDGSMVQCLQCVDIIEGYEYTSFLLYHPEIGSGEIYLGFVYTENDGEYTLTYLDGYVETIKVTYNNEEDRYETAE